MTVRRRRSDRSGRSKLHSPGRPDSARREELVRFWAAIATGRSSENTNGLLRQYFPNGTEAVSRKWWKFEDGVISG